MKYLLISLLAFLCHAGNAQDYTFTLYEYATGNYRAYSLQQTIDANFLIVANRDCYTPGSITIEGCPHSPDLIKIDESGNILWKSTFEEVSWLGRPVHENADGSFSIATHTHENYKCGDVFVGLFGLAKSLGFRISDDADLLSTKTFNDECDMAVVSSVRLPGDQIVFLQTFRDLSWTQLDTILTMTDKDFNTVWSTYLPGSESVDYDELIYTAQGELYLLMRKWETDSLALGRLDAFGTVVETTKINATVPIYLTRNVITTKNNQLIIVGWVPGAGMDPAQTVVLRTDLTGQVIWQKTYPSRNSVALLETQEGLTLLANTFDNIATDTRDILLTALDVHGDSLTSRIYDVNGDDVPVAMVETTSGNILLLGESNCCNYEAAVGPGEIFVLKDTTLHLVSGIQDRNKAEELSVVPNPANNEILIILQDQSDGSVSIYDMLSRKLYSGYISADPIDIGYLTQGTYIIQFQNEGIYYTGKFVKN